MYVLFCILEQAGFFAGFLEIDSEASFTSLGTALFLSGYLIG